MKDTEIRGLLLQKYYENRRGAFSLPSASDFNDQLTDDDILHVSSQLGEYGLIEWEGGLGETGVLAYGMGKITAAGVDVVEGEAKPPIAINFTENKNISISASSSNVVVGNSNIQNVNGHIEKVIQAIDGSNASEAEKKEAKSLLEKFLAHPLLTTLVGGTLNSLGQ